MDTGVSVIICCYNSAARIGRVLDHLAHQEGGGGFEIILVDNNCTDGTDAKAAAHWDALKSPVSLRIVQEKQAGLSYARIAGARAAKSETLIFCDDDNWPDPAYVRTAAVVFEENPSVAVAGGPIRGNFEVPLPDEMKSFVHLLAIEDKKLSGIITEQYPFLPGAGLVIRRSVFLKLLDNGFRFFCSDRIGSGLSSGGDTELSMALVLSGYDVYYHPDLSLQHFISKERVRKEYLVKLMRGISAALPVLLFYNSRCKGVVYTKALLRKDFFQKLKYVCNPLIIRALFKSENGWRNKVFYSGRLGFISVARKLLMSSKTIAEINSQIDRIVRMKSS